jgi:Mg2+-importing ATPase
MVSSIIFIVITLVISYLPFNSLFGFVPLPAPLMLAVIGMTALYVMVTEIAKNYFYSRMGNVIA